MGATSQPDGLAELAPMLSPAEHEVTAIRKPGLYAQYEFITDLRGPGWQKSRNAVIADIKSGARYYTEVDSPPAYLEITETGFGQKHLRTELDCSKKNDLLALPRFL